MKNIVSYPQSNCQIVRYFPLSGVGGSELHSAMTYIRAHPADITKWNVPGWTWTRVLRTFMSLESYSGDDGKHFSSYYYSLFLFLNYLNSACDRCFSSPFPRPLSLSISLILTLHQYPFHCLSLTSRFPASCPIYHGSNGPIPTTRYAPKWLVSYLTTHYPLD
jgi:choline dehydrogenase-like flavoprotein